LRTISALSGRHEPLKGMCLETAALAGRRSYLRKPFLPIPLVDRSR
jgi:hypothetical protein